LREHACLETPTGKFPSCGPIQAKSKGWYSLNSHKVIDPISFLIEPELNSTQNIPAIQENQYSLFTLKNTANLNPLHTGKRKLPKTLA